MGMVKEHLLSAEQVQFYRENGFVQVDGVLTPKELEEFRLYIEEVMSTKDGLAQTTQGTSAYSNILTQKVNTWRDHLGMAKYISHPRFARMALQLSGAETIRVFHDHALWKMPRDNKPTPWHQDAPYWPFKESNALSIWIALDDVDENNGCMKFVPGSHKAGKLIAVDWDNPRDLYQYMEEAGIRQTPVKVPLKAGSCTFHHGLTFHSAYSNVTDNPRRALAIIYLPDVVLYNDKGHPVIDGLGLQKDEPVRGSLFPVLASRLQ